MLSLQTIYIDIESKGNLCRSRRAGCSVGGCGDGDRCGLNHPRKTHCIQNAPTDISLSPQIDLIVSLKVAERCIVVRVTVFNNLKRDVFRIAPLKGVGKVAKNGIVDITD